MAVTATAWLGFATKAEACRCARVHPPTHIKQHDYIARVIVLKNRQIGKWSKRRNARATVKVIKLVKASPQFAAAETVSVAYEGRFANARRSSCSMELPFNQEFWLFATEKEGELHTHECSLAPVRGLFGDQKFQSLLEDMAAKR